MSENRILEPNPLAPTHLPTISYHFFKLVEIWKKIAFLEAPKNRETTGRKLGFFISAHSEKNNTGTNGAA